MRYYFPPYRAHRLEPTSVSAMWSLARINTAGDTHGYVRTVQDYTIPKVAATHLAEVRTWLARRRAWQEGHAELESPQPSALAATWRHVHRACRRAEKTERCLPTPNNFCH
jgi:hypothetical protein